MSDSSNDSPKSATPTDPENSEHGSKTLEQWQQDAQENACGMLIADGGARMIHQAMVMRNVDRLARKTQDGTLGEKTEDPPEEPMQVRVGTKETVENHYYGEQKLSRKGGVLGPLALGAALLAGGAGIPYGLGVFNGDDAAAKDEVEAPVEPTEWTLRVSTEEPE